MHCDPLPAVKGIIVKAYESGKAMVDLLPADYLAKHTEILAQKDESSDVEGEQEARQRIRIKLTNFYGSKGLSALHAIVIGLNDDVFPQNPNQLQDDEVCKFIVALTRAKRSCCLVHNGEFNKELGWMVNRPSKYIQLLPANVKQQKKYKIKSGLLFEY